MTGTPFLDQDGIVRARTRFVVEYILWDEATPRETHTFRVHAAGARDARLRVLGELSDDRISVTGVREEAA